MCAFAFGKFVDDVAEDEKAFVDVGRFVSCVLFVESFASGQIDEAEDG